jgi:DNA-binding NarL/FixJ family response regulator
MPAYTILVVDDYKPFSRFVCSTLERRAELQVIGQASDGLEAIQKAEELRPDLIILDIGLPKLNGIETARRVRKIAPHAKILFMSQQVSSDVIEEALRSGAMGYVHKSRAQSELLPAIDAVLGGRHFVSSGLKDYKPGENTNAQASHRHEVQFYSDDTIFLESFTNFIESALDAGNAVIVVATNSHRENLLPRLRARGLDIAAVIAEGRFISINNADAVAMFMVNDQPDPVRFSKVVGDVFVSAAKAAKGDRPRVVACGECAPLLWTQGKAEAAIRVEQLWDEIAKPYYVDTLCGYPLSSFHSEEDSLIFRRICAEHSAVHSR